MCEKYWRIAHFNQAKMFGPDAGYISLFPCILNCCPVRQKYWTKAYIRLVHKYRLSRQDSVSYYNKYSILHYVRPEMQGCRSVYFTMFALKCRVAVPYISLCSPWNAGLPVYFTMFALQCRIAIYFNVFILICRVAVYFNMFALQCRIATLYISLCSPWNVGLLKYWIKANASYSRVRPT